MRRRGFLAFVGAAVGGLIKSLLGIRLPAEDLIITSVTGDEFESLIVYEAPKGEVVALALSRVTAETGIWASDRRVVLNDEDGPFEPMPGANPVVLFDRADELPYAPPASIAVDWDDEPKLNKF